MVKGTGTSGVGWSWNVPVSPVKVLLSTISSQEVVRAPGATCVVLADQPSASARPKAWPPAESLISQRVCGTTEAVTLLVAVRPAAFQRVTVSVRR